jgi:oligogalacturonide transporter
VITDLFHELWATLRIRAFRLHLGMYIGGYISQDVLNAVLSYIIAFIFLGSVATASSITTWMACAQLVSVGLAIWLTLRIHAAASYRIALGFFGLGIIGFATLYFAGVADIGWFLAVAVIAGLGRGALNFIPWSVYNYMPDVDEIVTGRRREGAFAGVMTFIRKLLQSAVVFAVGPILDASGLVRSVKVQPVEVVNTSVTMMLVGSLGLMIFGFLVSLRFRLNRDTHTVLMDEIERFKKQPGTEPTPENRAIVEDLTGWKYEELWGKGKS